MQQGKVFWGHKASYNLTARILPQALFLPQESFTVSSQLSHHLLLKAVEPTQVLWSPDFCVLAVLPLCISAETPCPHHPFPVVSLQHSQGLQLDSSSNSTHTARGPAWKDLDRARADTAAVGKERKKPKQKTRSGERKATCCRAASRAGCVLPLHCPRCSSATIPDGDWSTSVASGHQGKETSLRREERLEEPAKTGWFGFA